MENKSEKTITERRLEAQRALEGEERGRKREEEERKKAEEEQRKKDDEERKIREEKEKRKLQELQEKDLEERKIRAEEDKKKESIKKKEEGVKKEKEEKIRIEEERKTTQEALLKQMRPPGKKLRPLSKEVKTTKRNGGEELKIPNIKTYRNDAKEAIKKQGESLTKIVLAEKKKVEEKSISTKIISSTKKRKERIVPAPKKTKHPILIITTGLIVLSISGGVLIYLYQTNKNGGVSAPAKEKETTVTIAPAIVDSLIMANTEKNIDVSKENIVVLNNIAKELRKTSSTGSIKNIYLTKTTTTFTAKGAEVKTQRILGVREFLSLWTNKIPALLSRSLSNKFMLGVYSPSPMRNIPFLILTTNSHEQTFAGMFGWEDHIVYDFYKLFGLEINETTQPFQDSVIRGKDVRVIKSQSGDTILLYSFIKKGMLVITTDEEALNKILFKLK